jgi:hypothetical protein
MGFLPISCVTFCAPAITEEICYYLNRHGFRLPTVTSWVSVDFLFSKHIHLAGGLRCNCAPTPRADQTILETASPSPIRRIYSRTIVVTHMASTTPHCLLFQGFTHQGLLLGCFSVMHSIKFIMPSVGGPICLRRRRGSHLLRQYYARPNFEHRQRSMGRRTVHYL